MRSLIQLCPANGCIVSAYNINIVVGIKFYIVHLSAVVNNSPATNVGAIHFAILVMLIISEIGVYL